MNGSTETNVRVISTQTKDTISGDIVFWNKSRPLTVDDFQGKIGGSNTENPLVLAQLNLGFYLPSFFEVKISENGSCLYEIKNYKVLAHVNKSKSWIRWERIDSESKQIAMLNHEQRHFDIVEIYSRILNKLINDEFRNKKFACPDAEPSSFDSSVIWDASTRIAPMEAMIDVEYQKSQEIYELEAGYIQFSEHQKRWNEKIDVCLNMSLNEVDQCLKLYSR
jgi:hypothetical protein